MDHFWWHLRVEASFWTLRSLFLSDSCNDRDLKVYRNMSGMLVLQNKADTSWDHFVLLDLPMNSWTSGKHDFSHSMSSFRRWMLTLIIGVHRFQSPNPTILSLTASLHISLRFLVLALVIMYILAVLRAGSFLQPLMRPIYMFLPEAWDETNGHKIWILGWDQIVYILVGQRLSLLQDFVLQTFSP